MEIPLQITFRNMTPSAAIEDYIREKTAKLQSFCSRITACRVIVEMPHRHHHKGKAYSVRIDLAVPGAELSINRASNRVTAAQPSGSERPETTFVEMHQPSKHAAHTDVYVAIRDAFDAAARRLQAHARRQSGSAKLHQSSSQRPRVLRP